MTSFDPDPHKKCLSLPELERILQDKIHLIESILVHTSISLEECKSRNLFSNSDVLLCSNTLVELSAKTDQLRKSLHEFLEQDDGMVQQTLEELQSIMDKLSLLFCGFGTLKLEDLFFITFGTSFAKEVLENPAISVYAKDKRAMLQRYARPIGYKVIYWKNKTKPRELQVDTDQLCSDKVVRKGPALELAPGWECYDVEAAGSKPFLLRVHGIRLIIHHEKSSRSLILTCLLPDLPISMIQRSLYVAERKAQVAASLSLVDEALADRVLKTLSLKDILVLGNNDLVHRAKTVAKEVESVKDEKIDATVKRFLDMSFMEQRQFLISLLTFPPEDNVQYITYLLYDLMSAKPSPGNGFSTESIDQQRMYDSFPLHVKHYFKDSMKNSMKMSREIFQPFSEQPKLTLEQQIVLMKTSDTTKEKAYQKLKEIKNKNDEGGSSKAKHYLEGLLRIPFGHFQVEPLLTFMDTIRHSYLHFEKELPSAFLLPPLEKPIMLIDIVHMLKKCKGRFDDPFFLEEYLLPHFEHRTAKELSALCKLLFGKQTATKKETALHWIREYLVSPESALAKKLTELEKLGVPLDLKTVVDRVDILEKSVQQIQQTLVSVEQTLDESIHGHSNAKKQILKIVSQWMTGEQSGYCFGFEGSPGIGKTSLAKHGLAKCLRLQNGQTRPFAFIALGGSCNGSTLEGHNYTYVNSTWGRIVDVLMDAKCMNPIIYIDELDKVSKTEHGKEIIGILTHLIDSTQNNVFQDKFFSGVDLDLSKALFVFSYNDPQQIDRILLDRIHRVHFDNLSLAEKLVIAQKYIIPELHQKMGFHHRTVALSEETLTHLIETYTYEPGVRKLKEVLFDLFGEINLQLLSDKILPSLPILITPENLATIYLRKYVKHTPMTIHVKPQVGVVLGLWASTCGKGGVLPIQSKWFPSSSIWELKLTGNQGDVMKESMNVAKTVVWNALGIERQGYWNTIFQTSKSHGIHVHCPDSSTPKDGPSAGTAIALSLYSLFCDLDVPHTIAITGEVNLQGAVTKIGGINEKWLGGIQAGVQHFLYPKDNEEDARLFFEKYPECKSKYQFSAIETFEQALRLVFPQL